MSEIIRETEKAIGKDLAYLLSPVLVNERGEVVDGDHRLRLDESWAKRTVPLSDFDTHRARLILNTARRQSDTLETDYNGFAEYLQHNEPGTKPWLVNSGQTIAERISTSTGIPKDTVLEYLDKRYKGPTGPTGDTPIGKGEQVRIPKELAPEIRALVTQVKTAADEAPGITRELIRTTKARLREQRKELNAAAKLPVELRSLVETGKLQLEIAQLLESKVPKKFLEAEAKHVIEERLNLEETESYLTVQETIYRLHEHGDKTERGKTPTHKIEFVKLNEWRIRGRTGPNINLTNLELTTVSGKRVHLFEEIQHALRKVLPSDDVEVHVIVWAKPRTIEAT